MDEPALSASSALTLRVLPQTESSYGLALEWAGTAVATSRTPLAMQIFTAGKWAWRRQGYSWIRQVGQSVLAGSEVPMHTAAAVVEDTYTVAPDGVHLSRRVGVRGTVPGVGFLSACEWALIDVAPDALWFIPGVWYRRNEHVPPEAIGSLAARQRDPHVVIREDRLPLPVMMHYDPHTALSFALAHLEAQPDTVAADDDDAPLLDERLAFGSLAMNEAEGMLAFWYPGTEGPVSYPPMWTLGVGNNQADSPINPFAHKAATNRVDRWLYRYHPIRDGLTYDYHLLLTVREEPTYLAALTATWRRVCNAYQPLVHSVDLARIEQVSLQLLERLVRRDVSVLGIPTWIDCFTAQEGKRQNTFGIGFVSRNLEAALLLLDEGHRNNRQELIETGAQILNFWTARGGLGLSHVEIDRTSEEWCDNAEMADKELVFLRDQSEAHLTALRAWQREQARGHNHPVWLTWARSYADWLCAHQQPDGSFYRAYDHHGAPQSTATSDGIHIVPFMLEMTRVTGNATYKQVALKVATYLWSTYHRHGEFIGGTLNNPNCYDKEAASMALEAYLDLFATCGEHQWLYAAQVAAQLCETWILLWDIPMPLDERKARFYADVPTTGLQLITSGSSAVDVYLTRHAADYARLAEWTGDQHYALLADILLHNTKLMVQLVNEYGYATPGLQIEHWSIGRGRGFGLNSGWLPWVSTSHAVGIKQMREATAKELKK